MRALLVLSALLATSSVALAQDPAKPPTRPTQSPTFPTPAAQNSGSEIERLTTGYEAAFNKGDAKALAALYAADAVRLGLNDERIWGRAAIEQFYVTTVGATRPRLTIRPGRTQLLSPDVAVTEGTYEVGDGGSGVYVITAVRQDGEWRLAAVVPVPQGVR